ncbi:MAG: ATP-binding cassette domain-containing protein [Thermincola sp.]|jgi:cobalt/nickel transport system ATP-binding protein|nr:ATP-binding cassette domain-containing protein [Thermincola sp.]MDT3703589.1 ATP-binding cassette domain-containing protein [Thermincola sp.]
MVLEAENVQFSYSDGTTALKDINLKIPQGHFCTLLGPNGVGKTTFFKVLINLLKPTRGEVRLDGQPVSRYSKEELYRRIGFVFQDPNDQLFAPTVGEDVAFGPTNLKFPPPEIAARVQRALEFVGMSHLINKPIHYLSYGQKKRVSIAGVLAMRPEIIILDEPTAGLDPMGVTEIMSLLVRLNKEEGITILMATHDVDLVPIYANHIFILFEGKIVLAGSPQEVFSQKQIIRNAQLRLPRVAHLGEILIKKDNLTVDNLPLTIGEARKMVVSEVRGVGDRHG